MSGNLANLPKEQRQAIENEKARLFEFWQQNANKAKVEAGRIWAEREKKKGRYEEFVRAEIAKLHPDIHQMVRNELKKLG